MENTRNNQEFIEMEDHYIDVEEVQEEPKEKFGAKLRRIAKKVGKVAIVVAAGVVGYAIGKSSEPKANNAVTSGSGDDLEYSALLEMEASGSEDTVD